MTDPNGHPASLVERTALTIAREELKQHSMYLRVWIENARLLGLDRNEIIDLVNPAGIAEELNNLRLLGEAK